MGFINYRASAGSGKTYQLVLEYLNLVLTDEKRFSHILAITFTNKAAAEMKERILSSLKKLSKGENEDLKKDLLRKNNSLKNIENKSGMVLKKILHNYSDFAVMTIDSFINRLVRAFSYETDIPPGFDVELNFSRMKNFVAKSIFSGIGKDPEITKIIRNFVISKMSQDKSWNVESNISDLQKEINRERTETPVENIMRIDPLNLDIASEELKKIFIPFMEELINLAKEGAQLITKSGLSVNEFANKNKGAAAFIIKTSMLNSLQVKQFGNFGDSNFRKGSWLSQKTEGEIREKIESIKDNLDNIQSRMILLIDEKFKNALTAFLIFENIYLLGLIGKINSFMIEYKNEYNVVPIYELTKKVHGIIENGDIPFIYYILGDNFENIMIDEFQDTSRMQWDSLFPLIENSDSEGKLNMGVGDEKQSIYRWRGGDMEIMNREISELFHSESLKIINLPHNFRSRNNIVDFNNKLFGGIRDIDINNELLKRIYGKMKQKGKSGEGGFVSIRFLEKEDYGGNVLIRIEEIIEKCLEAGFLLSDIAVLTRKKKEGKAVADHLLSKGIGIITPELLELYKNSLAIFLINLLKYTSNPEDLLSMAEIQLFLQSYFKSGIWTVEETERYFSDRNSVKFPECLKKFTDKKGLLLKLPLYEAVEELIRTFDLHKQLKSDSSGYITSFLDMILEYSEKEGGVIHEFLEWWDIHGTDYNVPTPENKNGVNIMTIHKAKGLEFPVVIIPFADWTDSKNNNLWLRGDGSVLNNNSYPPPYYVHGTGNLERSRFSMEWAEEKQKKNTDNINLFYVACTRAIDGLFILSKEKKIKEDTVDNHRLLYEITSTGEMLEAGEKNFTTGELIKLSKKKKDGATETIDEEKMISNRWSEKITIRERSEKFWDLTPDDQLNKIDRGIIIHDILSQISKDTSREVIINRLLFSGNISAEESIEINNELEKMFEIAEVKNWFYGPGELLPEKVLLTKEGVFRPDRVIISGNDVSIIDFKTGRESDSNIEQIQKYKEYAGQMGYENVKGILFYISTGKIVRI